jgi:plasmid stabilization system protein ParE
MQYRFSRQAERDIEEIGDFIARGDPRRVHCPRRSKARDRLHSRIAWGRRRYRQV